MTRAYPIWTSVILVFLMATSAFAGPATSKSRIEVPPMNGRGLLEIFASQCSETEWVLVKNLAKRSKFAEKTTPPMTFEIDGTRIKDLKTGATMEGSAGAMIFTSNGRTYKGSICEIAIAYGSSASRNAIYDLFIPPARAAELTRDEGLAVIALAAGVSVVFGSGCLLGLEIGGGIGAAVGTAGLVAAPVTVPAGAGIGAGVGCIVGGVANLFLASSLMQAVGGPAVDKERRALLTEFLRSERSFRNCANGSVHISGGGIDLKLTRNENASARVTLVKGNRSYTMSEEFARSFAATPNVSNCRTQDDALVRNRAADETRSRLADVGSEKSDRRSRPASN